MTPRAEGREERRAGHTERREGRADRRQSDMETQRTLGRIEVTLETVAADVVQVKAYSQRNSERIGSLERSRAWMLGAAAVVGAFLARILDGIRGAF